MKPWKERPEPKKHSISVGLFQMFLPTARDMGFTGDVEQLKDTDTNVNLGVQYLAKCSVRFHNVRGIACCHNAGVNTRRSVCQNDSWVVHYENKVEKAYRKYSHVSL
jgi:soluble lytic murein transglycosylase-like protein